MFTKNDKLHNMKLRKKDIMKFLKRRTSWYEKSAIPYMTRLLNNYKSEQMKIND